MKEIFVIGYKSRWENSVEYYYDEIFNNFNITNVYSATIYDTYELAKKQLDSVAIVDTIYFIKKFYKI